MSEYTLNINPFRAVDNVACLAEIKTASPDIATEMAIEDEEIVFEPSEPYNRWRNEEEKIIPIIMKHLFPATTCLMTWEDVPDGDPGGVLIGRGRKFDVAYEPTALTEDGNISLEQAEILLAGCPDCPFSDTVKQACADGSSTSCANEPFSSSWNYDEHGEHVHFAKTVWKQDVASDKTSFGYQEWVEHQLESLLNDVDLTGVESIEFNVSAEDGPAPDYFMVYTKKHQSFPQEVCSFNTEGQASELAKYLADSAGVQVFAYPI